MINIPPSGILVTEEEGKIDGQNVHGRTASEPLGVLGSALAIVLHPPVVS